MIRRRLGLAAQAAALSRLYSTSTVSIRGGVLRWRGRLRPSDLSLEYVVQIEYQAGSRPDVHVRHPALERRNGQKPPHLYPGDALCLFYPHAREWDATMLIAETIVPWASEWLLFYEGWLATGDWLGGGRHPNAGKSTRVPRLNSTTYRRTRSRRSAT